MFNGLYLLFTLIGSLVIGIALGAKLRQHREQKRREKGE